MNNQWPLWLVHWHETMVGWLLPASDGPEFRRSILAAVPAGVSEAETERWRHAIAVRRLRRLLQMQQPDEVRAAIEQVIAYHEDENRTEEMRANAWSAARSAESAAESAGETDKWSAAFAAASAARWSAKSAAESAARSAESAAESAKSAAQSAACAANSARWSALSAHSAWAAAQSVWSAREAARAEYRAQWRDFLEVVAQPE